jgi:hypothetical protein
MWLLSVTGISIHCIIRSVCKIGKSTGRTMWYDREDRIAFRNFVEGSLSVLGAGLQGGLLVK